MPSEPRLVRVHPSETPSRWRGVWIREASACRPKGVFYAKRVFHLARAPRSAMLHVAAHTRYTLYCNGVNIGRGPVRATHKALFFDSYDIADLLKEGENVLAAGVVVFGVPTYVSVPFEPGIAVEGEIEAGGVVERLCTDLEWRVIRAGAYGESATKYTFQAGWGEVYCAGKEIADWAGPSLNGWQTPAAIALDKALAGREMRPRMIPAMLDEPVPARRIAEVALTPPCRDAAKLADYGALMHEEPHLDAPDGVVEGADAFLAGEGPLVVRPPGGGQGALVALDLGGEVAGRLDFEVEGPAGAIMDIGYNEDYTGGRLFIAKGDLDGKEYRLADRYVLAEGRRRHVQEFVFRAGRYVQLVFRGFGRPIKLHAFKMRLGVYPAVQGGRFTCSDLAHSRLYQAGVSTLHLCMWDTYLDCPWREQAMWVGDMYVEALYDHLVFGDPRLARQCLQMAAHGMRPDGLLRSAYPSDQATTIPSFSLLWILSVANYTLYTGDTALLQTVKGEVKTLLETFGGWVRPDGLLDEPPELWNFYDWGHRPSGGPDGILPLLYAAALRAASGLVERLGERDTAEDYRARAARAAEAVNRLLWDDTVRAYRAGLAPEGERAQELNQHVNALAVFFGFAPPERMEGALDALERPETDVRQAEPFYTFFVLGALGRGGRPEAALRLLRGRFGPMLEKGPGTIWENSRGKTVANEGFGVEWVSLCHAFSCAMLYFYPAQTLGVEPLSEGFARFRCAPKPGGLEFAQGVVPAPVGDIDVSWVDDDRRFSLSLGVPLAGTECQVELPCKGTVSVADAGGNEYPLDALDRLGPGRYTIIVHKRRE